MNRPRLRAGGTLIGAAVLLLLGSVASLFIGSEDVSAAAVVEAVRMGPLGDPAALADEPTGEVATLGDRIIVWNLRIPRTLVGAVVGAALAAAGVLLQGVLQNPLAAPSIVGVTGGAGLGATLLISYASGVAAAQWLPAVCFVGAFGTSVLVYAMSWQPGRGTSVVRMILSGVALTAVFGAISTFVMIEADRAADIVGWMAGSLEAASWDDLRLILPWIAVGAVGAALLAGPLNVLQLGDDSARGLGVNVERVRLLGMAAAGLLVGAAVGVAGLLGFVGLIVPHAVKLLVGPRHGWVLGGSLLGGAALIVIADTVSRRILGDRVLPLGVLTSLLSGPYFLWLLHRMRLVR